MGKIIPEAWMPLDRVRPSRIRRIVMHWTAGAGSPSSEDKDAYHLLIDRVGHVHRGEHSITDNLITSDGDYAAHTRGLNTGSIGLALCGMAGATPATDRHDFAPGKYPLTASQWNAAIIAAADLCRRYDIEPDQEHLLMHCEVERFLGVKQAQKWDVSVLPFERGKWGSVTPGEEMRARVKILLSEEE
jgi:N-acetyl-anhydromuramyl-L-alanine amidase AmpD